MFNLLWLLPIPFAARFVGMGTISRLISLPIASLVIGGALTMALGKPLWMIPVIGILFAVGRMPTVADGLDIVIRQKIDPARDSWDSAWIRNIAFHLSNNVFVEDTIWSLIRIIVFYLPLFLAVSLRFGLFGAIAYGIAWAGCYAVVVPIWKALKWTPDGDCAAAAEWAECVLFAVILGVMVCLPKIF